MNVHVQLVQRVGIDMDEDGIEPGDGAALVDLATLERHLELPFTPFEGLCIRKNDLDFFVDELIWVEGRDLFVCKSTTWVHTQEAADAMMTTLLEAGFSPLEDHHREPVH